MEYIKVSKAAEKWGISARRVRILCAEGKIDGVIRKGNLYMIPENAQKPRDGRLSKYNILDEIEEKKAKLDSMRPLTPGEVKRLREEFMIEFTHNSTAIEGNTLTLKETAMVLEGMTIDQKPLKDHLEAVGHRDAFLYVCDIAAQEVPLNESTIKNIHSLVLMNQPEDKGVYRKIPVRIMGAFTEPVQPYLIEPKITELLASNEERKATMSVIERVALFHLEFEGVHPFIDGNGRTGRLLLNLELIRNGYPAINVKFTDRRRYYDAFDSYYRDGNSVPMVELVAEYVSERYEDYFRVLENYFENKDPTEKLFSAEEMNNKLNIHKLRALCAQNAYRYYEKQIAEKGDSFRETMEKELRARWQNCNIDKRTGKPKRFDEKQIQGFYFLRGKNKEYATEDSFADAIRLFEEGYDK